MSIDTTEPTDTTTPTQASATPGIAHGCWRLDPARSSVEFRTPTLWGRATVKGSFARYEGTLDLERDPAIEMTIDAGSLSTGNSLRDRHLRSADFFDVSHHPQVRFTSDSARLDGDRLEVHGHLEAAGNSLPLEMEAILRPVGDEYEIEARTHADHRRLGMSHGVMGMIPTPSELTVRGRLVR